MASRFGWGCDVGALEETLHLTAEQETPVRVMIIKRLLPTAIPPDEELALPNIINAKRAHPVHPLQQAFHAPFFETVDEALRIAMRLENVPFGLQFLAQFEVIVGLAVVAHGQGFDLRCKQAASHLRDR